MRLKFWLKLNKVERIFFLCSINVLLGSGLIFFVQGENYQDYSSGTTLNKA